ncbi:SDR family NAD(P)-dependent oxidoreductase, partial [Bacillus mobilis]|uniref:SDR family NAD(P)-dependent oxidoreductase n=2 Tax=Bacillati TaxID=1783272 RepID=UPI003626BA88
MTTSQLTPEAIHMHLPLTGKTAVVTGGARGIGQAIVNKLRAQGANVNVVDLTVDENENAQPNVISSSADVTDQKALDAVARRSVEEFGSLDIWINCAGIAYRAPADSSDIDKVRQMLDINTYGTYFGCLAAKKHMGHAGGAVVNIASIAATRHLANRSWYGLSKAGVVSLTRSLATEWGPEGIRVNAVAPGTIATPMTTWITDNPTVLAEHTSAIPLA